MSAFPGELAGASLKPRGVEAPGGAGVRPFPGELAGASLKPRRRPTEYVQSRAFPRRTRRGLIEAFGDYFLPK